MGRGKAKNAKKKKKKDDCKYHQNKPQFYTNNNNRGNFCSESSQREATWSWHCPPVPADWGTENTKTFLGFFAVTKGLNSFCVLCFNFSHCFNFSLSSLSLFLFCGFVVETCIKKNKHHQEALWGACRSFGALQSHAHPQLLNQPQIQDLASYSLLSLLSSSM